MILYQFYSIDFVKERLKFYLDLFALSLRTISDHFDLKLSILDIHSKKKKILNLDNFIRLL